MQIASLAEAFAMSKSQGILQADKGDRYGLLSIAWQGSPGAEHLAIAVQRQSIGRTAGAKEEDYRGRAQAAVGSPVTGRGDTDLHQFRIRIPGFAGLIAGLRSEGGVDRRQLVSSSRRPDWRHPEAGAATDDKQHCRYRRSPTHYSLMPASLIPRLAGGGGISGARYFVAAIFIVTHDEALSNAVAGGGPSSAQPPIAA